MAAAPKLAPSRMTVAEFLAWPGDGTGQRFELVDGEPRAMAPASITHGRLQSAIARLIGIHLAGTPCDIVTAPGVIPRVRASANFRIPDLAVTCTRDESGQRTLPDPTAIIEILSPSNETETRENLWAYATIPSVREILLVSASEVTAELLRRLPDGTWPEAPLLIGGGDSVRLDSIDYTAPLADFYARTHLARARR